MSYKPKHEETHPTRLIPDHLLQCTKVNEDQFPTDCKTDEIIANYWRLKACLSLGSEQAQDLFLAHSRNLPLSAVPIHTQAMEVIEKIVARRDEIYEKIDIYFMTMTTKIDCGVINSKLPKFMKMHSLTKAQKQCCFELLQINLSGRDEATLKKITHWLDIIEDDIDLLLEFAKSRAAPGSRADWEFLSQFALFPFKQTKEKYVSLLHFITNPPKDLINITDYLGLVDERKFSSVEELREDPRTLTQIFDWLAADYVKDEKNADNLRQKELKLKAGLLWTRLVKDTQTLKKAVYISCCFIVRIGLKFGNLSTEAKEYISFDSLIEAAKQTKDIFEAKLINLLFLARNSAALVKEKFFTDQVEEPNVADDSSEPNYSNSFVYQLLTQLCSTKLQINFSAQENESAFEQTEPELVWEITDGPLNQAQLKDARILTGYFTWSKVIRVQFKENHRNFFWWIEREMLGREGIEIFGNRVVLPWTKSYWLNLMDCCGELKRGSNDIDTYKAYFEKLFARWTAYLDKDLYWPTFDGKLVEVSYEEKTDALALLLDHMQITGRTGIPDNYGALLLDGPLFRHLDQTFLPQANILGPKSVNKIITGYLKVLTLMLQNEPNLISRLLKQEEGDDLSGLLIRLFEALTIWTPNNSPTKVLPYKENIRIVLKLFLAIAINDENIKIVEEYGPKIISTILSSRGSKATFLVQEVRDENVEIFSFRQNYKMANLDLIRRTLPKVIQAISDHVNDKIQQSQVSALDLQKEFDNNLLKYKHNANIAKRMLYEEHLDKIQVFNSVLSLTKQKASRDDRLYNMYEDDLRERAIVFETICAVVLPSPKNLEQMEQTEALNQLKPVIKLVETLNYIGLRKQTQGFKDIIQNVVDSVKKADLQMERQVQKPQTKKILIERLKESLKQFNDETFILTCSTYDQLCQHAQTQRIYFTNLKLWAYPKLINSAKIGFYYDWRNDIKLLLHVQLLRAKKQIELAYQQMTDPEQRISAFDNQENVVKAMPKSQEIKDLKELFSLFKQLQIEMGTYTDQAFGVQPNETVGHQWMSSWVYLLHSIFVSTNNRNDRHHFANGAAKEVAEQNCLALGQALAQVGQQVKLAYRDDNELRQQMLHNYAVLQVMLEFRNNFKNQDEFQLGFIIKKGFEPLCKLYKSLTYLCNKMYPQNHGELTLEQYLLKILIVNTKFDCAQILYSIVKTGDFSSNSRVKDDKVKTLTQNMCTSAVAFYMNFYAGMYESLLDWTQEQVPLILDQQNEARDDLIPELVKSVMSKPWLNWKSNNNRQREDHPNRPPWHQQEQQDEDREPTQDELDLVCACGFDPYLAGFALRMARFNTQRAVNILMDNQDGLLQFIEKDRVEKQQKDLEKAKLASQPKDNENSWVYLTEEQFNQKRRFLKKNLLNILVETTESTLLTQKQAIEAVHQIQTKSSDKEKYIKLFVKQLDQSSTISQKEFLLKALCYWVLKAQVYNDQTLPLQFLCTQGQQLLKMEKNGKALYFLMVLLFEITKKTPFIQEDQGVKVLNSQVYRECESEEAREIVMYCRYFWLQSMDQKNKLKEMASFEEDVIGCNSIVKNQIVRSMLHLQHKPEHLFNQFMELNFVTTYLYKKELFKLQIAESLSKEEQEKAQSTDFQADIKLIDVCAFIRVLNGGQLTLEQMKPIIETNCRIVKPKSISKEDLLCQLKDGLADKVKAYLENVAFIQKLKKNKELLSLQFEKTKIYFQYQKSSLLTKLIEIFTTGSNQYDILKSDNKDVKMMPKKWKVLEQIAQVSRVHPQLLLGFDRDFAQVLLKQIGEVTEAKNLKAILFDCLTPLLGTSRQSTLDEFVLRTTLKQQILDEAATILNQNIENRTHIFTALAVTITLTNDWNLFESNKVIASTAYFRHSIDYLLKETSLIADLSKLTEHFVSFNDEEQKEWADIISLCIFQVQQISQFLQQKKALVKKQKRQQAPNHVDQLVQPQPINGENGDHSSEEEPPLEVQALEVQVDEDNGEEDNDDDDDNEEDGEDSGSDVEEDPHEHEMHHIPEDEEEPAHLQFEGMADEEILQQLEEELQAEAGELHPYNNDENDILSRPRAAGQNDPRRFDLEEFIQNNAQFAFDNIGNNEFLRILHEARRGNHPNRQREVDTDSWTLLEQEAQTLYHRLAQLPANQVTLSLLENEGRSEPGHIVSIDQNQATNLERVENQISSIEHQSIKKKFDAFQPLSSNQIRDQLYTLYTKVNKDQQPIRKNAQLFQQTVTELRRRIATSQEDTMMMLERDQDDLIYGRDMMMRGEQSFDRWFMDNLSNFQSNKEKDVNACNKAVHSELAQWLNQNNLVEEQKEPEKVDEQKKDLSRLSGSSEESKEIQQPQVNQEEVKVNDSQPIELVFEPLGQQNPQPHVDPPNQSINQQQEVEPVINQNQLILSNDEEESKEEQKQSQNEVKEEQPSNKLFTIEQVQQPSQEVDEPEMSAFEMAEIEEAKEEVKLVEEQKDEVKAEQVANVEEEQKEAQESEPMAFGVPVRLIEEFGFSLEIIEELDEESRREILAEIDYHPPQAQTDIVADNNNNGVNNNAAVVDEDPFAVMREFLEQLPPELRAEAMEQHRREQEQAQAEIRQQNNPQVFDLGALIASLEGEAREEAILQLAADQVPTLPEALQQEYAQLQERERARAAQRERMLQQQEQEMDNELIFGNGRHGRNEFRVSPTQQFENREAAVTSIQKLQEFTLSPLDELYYAYNTMTVDDFDDVEILSEQEVEAKVSQSGIVEQAIRYMVKVTGAKVEGELPNIVDLVSGFDKDFQKGLHIIVDQVKRNFDKILKGNQVEQIDTSSVADNLDQVVIQTLVLMTFIRAVLKQGRFNTQNLLDQAITSPEESLVLFAIEQLLKSQQLQSFSAFEPDKQKKVKGAIDRNLQLLLETCFQFCTSIHTTDQSKLQRLHKELQKEKSLHKVEDTLQKICKLLEIKLSKGLEQKLRNLFLLFQDFESSVKLIKELCMKHREAFLQKIIDDLNRMIASVQKDSTNQQLPMLQKQPSSDDSLLLQKKMSSIQSHTVQLSKEETTKLCEQIQESESTLPLFDQLTRLMSKFVEKNESLSDSKRHFDVLTQLLMILKQQKGIPNKTLQIVGRHVSTLFEMCADELAKINKDQKEAKEESEGIKLISFSQKQLVSEKEKISLQIFRQKVDVSDLLYELCIFSSVNQDFLNKILKACETMKENQPSFVRIINYMPNLLNLERKQANFRHQLDKYQNEVFRDARHLPEINVKIKREQIFTDAYAQLQHRSSKELRGELKVKFHGEAGLDYGGLTRDFYICLSRDMFNPQNALFSPTSNGVSFHPNTNSYVNPDHLNFFRFIGRIIGKALFDGHLLELQFSKAMYKLMVGDSLEFEDLRDLDNEFYRSCEWILNNDPSNNGIFFSVNQEFFGKYQELDLKEGGRKTEVTEANKHEYLELLALWHMYKQVKDQCDAFLKGFHDMVPKKFVSIFSASELELLISGLPKVDLEDMKVNTRYEDYTPDSDQIKWLWRLLENFTQEEMGKFLQFVTGSSRVPLAGFSQLQGMHGIEKLTIKRIRTNDVYRLPQGHTCFNSLDLPEYTSYELMQERVLYAINNAAGFGFA